MCLNGCYIGKSLDYVASKKFNYQCTKTIHNHFNLLLLLLFCLVVW